ncbi:MAG: carbohydrate ABC transporter substrate-binding protein, partial [Mesorhizobium sp.]|nr:carbohydrate ABC transporter substrate-binding protein [Mesorhizobium sp.]
MTKNPLTTLLGGASLRATAGIAMAADATLTIESWRNDDLSIWQDKLIPAFEAKNPGIKVTFAPSAPTEYDAALGAKLQAGSAGDLISCRPFDKSLELFKKGNLADLSALSGMENFSDTAKAAWQTDDGKST